MPIRFTLFGVFASTLITVLACNDAGAVIAPGVSEPQELKNFDAYFDDTQINAGNLSPEVQLTRQQRKRLTTAEDAALHGFRSHFDANLGVPTFLWTPEGMTPATVGPLTRQALIESWARDYLSRQASVLGLTPVMIRDAELTEVHDLGRGPLIARFQQRHAGLPVFTRHLNVMMRPSGDLVATSGYFAADLEPSEADATRFSMSVPEAIALAFAELGGSLDASAFTLDTVRGEYTSYAAASLADGVALTRNPRTKKVLYPLPLRLVPAYYVELMTQQSDGSGQQAYSFAISANDGATLFRKNLVSQAAYSYRVFADPTGINQPLDAPIGNDYAPFPGTGPDDILMRTSATAELVTLEHGPISTGDPWLPPGATVTTGNNVDAYIDSGVDPSASPVTVTRGNTYVEGSGDTRASTTGANTFDYAIVADQNPAGNSARHAANVNLFYLSNWLHDWWYDHGFDEAAGNAQSSNFGRGGKEADPLIAQGQDSSGRNNSAMFTFADGLSPIMQMYLWDGEITGEVSVQNPAGMPPLPFAAAPYGPKSYNVTNDGVLVNDGVGASNTDGCAAGSATASAPPQPTLQNKIALIDQGNCDFTTKTRFAQASGAVAAVIVLSGNDLQFAAPTPAADTSSIPTVFIRNTDGQILKDILAGGGTLRLLLRRDPSIDRDGTLDNQLIAHEFFHYVSNRLVGDNTGLGNNQGKSLGEGWSDMNALLLSIRPQDRWVAGNDLWQGSYPLAYYVTADYYYGIRRVPYSTDFSRNALTFKHIADGVPLPTSAPMRGSLSTNAQVHNAGEIWATMLLECYAGILRRGDLDFDQAQDRMKDYLIAGLKMTPASPTFTEARDALLAAVLATDYRDFAACARGFARRGAGLDAVSPPRTNVAHAGVVESYLAFRPKFPILGVSYVPNLSQDCDADNVLDGGEGGALQLTVRNDSNFVPDQAITAHVSTTLPGVTFASNGLITIPPLALGGSATVSVDVSAGTLNESRTTMPLVLAFDPVADGDPAVAEPPVETSETILHYDGELQDEDGVCINHLPTAVAGPDLTINEEQTGTLNGSGRDPDSGQTQTLSYFWSQLDGPAIALSATDVPAPSFTAPRILADSIATLRLTVTDSAGGSVSDEVVIGILNVNTPPLANAGADLTIPEGQIGILDGSGSDPDSGQMPTLVYAWSQLDGATITLSATDIAAPSFTVPSVPGDHTATLRLTVTDNAGESSQDDVVINIVNLNNAPIANAGVDFTVDENTGAMLSAALSSDADGEPLSYDWTQTSGPGVALTDPGSASPSFTAPDVTVDAVLVFQLKVQDPYNSQNLDTISVTVRNVAPASTASSRGNGGGMSQLALLVLGLLGLVRRRTSVEGRSRIAWRFLAGLYDYGDTGSARSASRTELVAGNATWPTFTET